MIQGDVIVPKNTPVQEDARGRKGVVRAEEDEKSLVALGYKDGEKQVEAWVPNKFLISFLHEGKGSYDNPNFGRHKSIQAPFIQKMLSEGRDPWGLTIFGGTHEAPSKRSMYEQRTQQPIKDVKLEECFVQSYWHQFHCPIKGVAINPDGDTVSVGFDLSNCCWYPVEEQPTKGRF